MTWRWEAGDEEGHTWQQQQGGAMRYIMHTALERAVPADDSFLSRQPPAVRRLHT